MSASVVVEQAKKELEILEFHHPNRFQYLKMELKTFISDFESHNYLLVNNTSISTCHSSAFTQESSNGKKRKNVDIVEVSACRFVKRKRGNKTDAVLERAQECINKIHQFKTSLC